VPHRVYIGLGSNRGESRAILEQALQELHGILEDLSCSSLYRTDPVGRTDQPSFLNAVCAGITAEESASRLLERLQQIERRFGRDRAGEIRWGPRTLDLDLLLFGRTVRHEESPFVPHPEMHQRAFVLVPLCELDPELTDPRNGTPYTMYLGRLGSDGVYYEEPSPYTLSHHTPWKSRSNQNREDTSASMTSRDH
jgi:2-amino-4-hydroxy-6-hydroxymethyldihydropteridine diphosphokinase